MRRSLSLGYVLHKERVQIRDERGNRGYIVTQVDPLQLGAVFDDL